MIGAGPEVATLAFGCVSERARPAEAKGRDGIAAYEAWTCHLIVLPVYRSAVGARLHRIPNSSGGATTVRVSPLRLSSEQMLGCLACSEHNNAIVSLRRETPKIYHQAHCKIACRSFAAPARIFCKRLGFPKIAAMCSACANVTHPADPSASTERLDAIQARSLSTVANVGLDFPLTQSDQVDQLAPSALRSKD